MYIVEVKHDGKWKEVDSGESYRNVRFTVDLFVEAFDTDRVRVRAPDGSYIELEK